MQNPQLCTLLYNFFRDFEKKNLMTFKDLRFRDLRFNFIFFWTKINDIHSFKLIEYIDTIQIQIR